MLAVVGTMPLTAYSAVRTPSLISVQKKSDPFALENLLKILVIIKNISLI